MSSVGCTSIFVSILLYLCGILLRICGFFKRVLCCHCLRESPNSVNRISTTGNGKLRIVALSAAGDDRPFLIRKFSDDEKDLENLGKSEIF